ncbi:hypothetical protein YWH7199_01750 [Fusobacterium nucleatum YWH7199]|uniref:hypothetical protein n=1 Tax=Fusobacterium nucleatum TaxID=851 RepID=UPI00201A5EED|nr:hypothetical protein [Fusobacterium nucleatum]MCL4580272.1 hypothetical protein [Fusobacterium nucleatum YWH7199]
MEFLSKESINSKELLKQINYFRKLEYQEKKDKGLLTVAQNKRGHYIELRHDNLLRTIRDEFNIQDNHLNFEEVKRGNAVNKNAVKNNNHYKGPIETTYKDDKGELRPMFILTIDQAKQVLMRESKVVRKAVIRYLNLLEKRIRELERKKGKITRKQETEAIKTLMEYGNIPNEKQHLYYMTYSKLPFIVLGMKKVSRDTLPADDLNLIKELESIIQVTILTSIIKGLDVKAIYQECKKVCNEALENTEQKLIS